MKPAEQGRPPVDNSSIVTSTTTLTIPSVGILDFSRFISATKSMKPKQLLLVAVVFYSLLTPVRLALAQGTAFTYQGRLNDGANPAHGNYDLTFGLFSVSSGAGQVGNTLTNSATAVSNGLFTVTLDFGNQFPGADRWLEMSARTNGNGAFTTLSPRQKLTPTPYAITAENVVPGAGLSGTYSSAVTLNNPGNSFSGNGAGLTNVWHTAGNAGAIAGPNFLGTTDNQPLELHVNGQRALRLEPNAGAGPNVIGGAPNNFVAPGIVRATIAGGELNTVSGPGSTVGGGYNNTGGGIFAVIGGGYGNQVTGPEATVAGGDANIAGSQGSTVGGGVFNQASGPGAFVGGGGYDGSSFSGNTASGAASTVAGGFGNSATNSYATVGGGNGNKATGPGSFVGGGGFDGVSAVPNTASGEAAVVGGGELNVANGPGTFIGGGYNNANSGIFSVVGGGYRNTASGPEATVAGGDDNKAGPQASTVAGGSGNQASGSGAFVGGGGFDGSSFAGNTASGGASTVAGGFGNQASGVEAAVGGGDINVASGPGTFIGGGYNNVNSGIYSVVGGGYRNTASGPEATVAGGDSNTAGPQGSTVAGGVENQASGPGAFVGGGGFDGSSFSGNIASGAVSTVAGGLGNSATNSYATVGGGLQNNAGGFCAAVPGGSSNVAAGRFSFAGGQRAVARLDGTFVWADSDPNVFDPFGLIGPQGFANSFNVRSSAGFYIATSVNSTNGQITSGVYVAGGGSGWNSLSDRNAKTDFSKLDAADMLRRLVSVPVLSWNYKSQDASVRHIGPMAQDFNAAFGVGEPDKAGEKKYINSLDEEGVALAAIQGLNQKVEEENHNLRAELRDKQSRIAELETRLSRLERLIGVEGE
jgi:hypothetical protein